MTQRGAILLATLAAATMLAGCAELYRGFGPPGTRKRQQLIWSDLTQRDYYGLLSASPPEIQRWSILGLARHGDPEAVLAIVIHLDVRQQPSPLVRSTAAVALRMFGDPRAIPYLKQACSDPIPLVRADVVSALAAIGGPDELPILRMVLLNDRDTAVRQHAARGLARIGGTDATAALIAHLNDPDESVAFECHRMLVRIAGKDLPPRAYVWKKHFAAIPLPPSAKPSRNLQ